MVTVQSTLSLVREETQRQRRGHCLEYRLRRELEKRIIVSLFDSCEQFLFFFSNFHKDTTEVIPPLSLRLLLNYLDNLFYSVLLLVNV